MALSLAKALSYYKRRDVQEELVRQAKDKEVAFRYTDFFGKRPDILAYPADILELAKNRMTSIHCSEELWSNPLQISVGLKKEDLNSLRKGWDFILDIDCPVWKLSKIITWLIVKSLKEHDVKSITIKFSGNKGFHIAVPFEAFPEKIGGLLIKDKFPELPIKMALYLLDYISQKHILVDSSSVTFGNKFKIDIEQLTTLSGKKMDALTYLVCRTCKTKLEQRYVQKKEYVLSSSDVDFIDQSAFRKDIVTNEYSVSSCKCEKPDAIRMFNPSSILEVDTILISSRHLYRMPYSLHEKSGLVSVPFNADKILEFEKEDADPAKVSVLHPFLERPVGSHDAETFLKFALDSEQGITVNRNVIRDSSGETRYSGQENNLPDKAIGEESFPPCVRLIFEGIEDGKKRSAFALMNFLLSCGWSPDQVEQRLIEWNKKNREPLRDQFIIGQMRYARTQNKKPMPPPGCNNAAYYKGIQVCKPDQLCAKIKNPIQYAKLKSMMLERQGSVRRKAKATPKNKSQVGEGSSNASGPHEDSQTQSL
jgi:hypothetical protein